MKRMMLLGMAAVVLGACAQVDTSDPDHAWVERTYRTGSNLPSKHSAESDGVTSVSKEDMDKARDSSQSVPRGFNLPGPK
ncbi:MAG TPA: hypothetical protein VH040_18475 [Usitatibacter sp.]|jgi:hypothetical protein|nr:hypothetical protein [Usitatibacter sp.]